MDNPLIFLPFLIAFFLAIIFTLLVKKMATYLGVVDCPDIDRKIHKQPKPLLGGLAVFLAFFLTLIIVAWLDIEVFSVHIKPKHLIGIFIAACFLMLGGVLDDKYSLRPRYQIIWPILATLIVIASGVGIVYLTNPFGGIINVASYHKILFWFKGWPYRITLPADIITLIWLMGMMYTTKFLDGLDGLVSGITVIGAVIIFALSLILFFAQTATAVLAMILAGVFAGFLIFNWHPAKIFLGEGGSLFAGFMLGVLAISSGSKIATTMLVMGIPILDVAWVIIRRLFWEKKSPLWADKKHFHFRLLDIGFSHRKAVLFLYFLTAYFGIAALFLQSQGKLIALIILSILMLILASWLVWSYKKKKQVL